ncbi:MAG: hypothetical protein AB7R89_09035 [Dehalococcoidia bacterium]
MNRDTRTTLTPFAARVYGVATILAPLLLLASTVAYITAGEGINEGVLGGTIGVWSAFAMTIAFVGILRLLEPRAPRAAVTLTVIALIGWAAGIAFNIEAIYVALIPELTVERLNDAMTGGDAIAWLAFLPWGWFAPLTFVLSGIFLWRTHTVAPWTGILLIIGGVLFVTARPARIDVLAVTGDIVLVLALAPIGWSMFVGRRLAGSAAMATATAAPEPLH